MNLFPGRSGQFRADEGAASGDGGDSGHRVAAFAGAVFAVDASDADGQFPQRIRWQAHRYLLRQSMSYFQDEFAGRSPKLMQTALAVREVAMKFMDVLTYVGVYFIGALILRPRRTGFWRCRFWAGGGLWRAAVVADPAHRPGQSGAGRRPRGDDRPRRRQLYQHLDGQAVSHSVPAKRLYVRRKAWTGFWSRCISQMRLASIQNILLSTLNSVLTFSVTRWGCGCGARAGSRSARSRWRSRWRCGWATCRIGSCGNSPVSSRISAPCATASVRLRCRAW